MAGYDISITRIMIKGIYTKPGISIFGFIFTILLCQFGSYGSEYLFTNYLDMLWRRNTELPMERDDTGSVTRVATSFNYNDIYHEKRSHNGQDVKNVVGEAYNSTTHWLHQQPEWGMHTVFTANGYYGNWTDRGNEGLFRFSQDLQNVNVCAWIRKTYAAGGVLLGKSFSDIIDKKSTYNLMPQQIITGMNRDISFNYALFISGFYKNITIKGSVSRFLNQALTPMYQLFSNGHFKTFPLSAATKTYALDLQTSWQFFTVGVVANKKLYTTDSIIDSDNDLPFVSELISRELGLYGTLGKTPFLLWNCMLDYTGGYIKGVSGSFDYLKQDGIVLKSVDGNIRCILPYQFTGGIFGEYLLGETTEYGYFKADPFSSWNFLNPQGYRFHDAALKYYEAGVFAGKTFSIGKRNLLYTDISFSRTRGKLTINREEKKIVVLFPIYVNDTYLSLFNFEGYTISLKLNNTYSYKKISVVMGVRQRVPIWKDVHDSWSGGTGTSTDTVEKKVRGGTEYTIKFEYLF